MSEDEALRDSGICARKSYDFGQDGSARCAVPFKLRELADALEGGKIPKT